MSYNTSSSKQGLQHAIVRRLEQFFRVADLRCAKCGKWLGDPREFGIRDEAEWEARMVGDLLWIRANARDVLEALPAMDEEWSSCCTEVKNLLQLPA